LIDNQGYNSIKDIREFRTGEENEKNTFLLFFVSSYLAPGIFSKNNPLSQGRKVGVFIYEDLGNGHRTPIRLCRRLF
jgi:hypothetical protein